MRFTGSKFEFLKKRTESDKAVCAVAYMLRMKGCTVQLPAVPPLDGDEVDDGDMTIIMPSGDVYGAEVKGMKIEFPSKKDFPHPKIIVDACYHWDELDPKPDFYFICNQSLSLALIISTSTFSQWEKFLGGHTDTENFGDGKRWYYRAPKNLWKEQTLDPFEISGVGFWPETKESA